MIGVLAHGDDIVVTTATGPEHFIVIDSWHHTKADNRMTSIAVFRGIYVARWLA